MEVIAKRYRPLAAIGSIIICSHKGEIASLNLKSNTKKHICDLPIDKKKRFFAQNRKLERLMRTEAKIAVPLSEDEMLLSYRGGIYSIQISTGEISKEFTYRNGMNGPMVMIPIQGVEGFDDCIAFGEYTLNSQRKNPSAIFVRDYSKGEWKKVFEFDPGQIRHIHGLTPDVENHCVYILTGDFGNEAGIWKATDNFREVNPVLTGSQMYRTGYLFKTEKGYIYATDTALEQNYLYCISGVGQKDNGWTLSPFYNMPGSCVSSGETSEKVLFSSTVEADESIRGWRSWVNMKRGPGIVSDYTTLVSVDKKTHETKVIFQAKKDVYPYKLFQYGYMKVIDVPESEAILVYPVGVKRYDGVMLMFQYKEL